VDAACRGIQSFSLRIYTNMTNIYFTSDTHFGHKILIDKNLRARRFSSIEEHDELIIENWNKTVKRGDMVYHLGDFAWHDVAKYRKRLNGQIHLIKGNHDRLKSPEKAMFESISDIRSINVLDGQKVYLCHYAMRVWNQSHHGSWHLYGHSHGSLLDDPASRSFDIGVDCWDFAPVSVEQVAAKMATKRFIPIDHHA